jgi:hypothetical protein
MANVNFSDIYWGVRAQLPGVPLPLLHNHFGEAVREFIAKSHAWQHNCPVALDLAADTAWFTLVMPTDIPTGTYVVEPVNLKRSDGTNIAFQTRDQLDEIDPDWEQAEAGQVDFWTITGPSAWRVYPLLTDALTDEFYLRVSLAPTVASGAVPEELANEFRSTWDKGALARLLAIPGKDWTNPVAAQVYQSQYEEEIAMAKSRAAADYGRPHRFVRYGGLAIGGAGTGRIKDDYGR